ncbi:hypothetical protein CHUAL_009607 [Chamberlinius hualienensis]
MNDRGGFVSTTECEDQTRCCEYGAGAGNGRRILNKKLQSTVNQHNNMPRVNKEQQSLSLQAASQVNLFAPSNMYDSSASSNHTCKLHYPPSTTTSSGPYTSYPSRKKYLNSDYDEETTNYNYTEDVDPHCGFYIPKTSAGSSYNRRRSPPPFLQPSFLQQQTTINSTISTQNVQPVPQSEQQPSQNDVNSNNSQRSGVSEVNVLLKNNVAVCLEVENFSSLSCKDLVQLILSEPQIELTEADGEIFALWMVSSLFEVQLKPEHRPFSVWKKWSQLLAKYTAATEVEREKDWPHLSLQRDVFYLKRDEIRLGNSMVLELLYEEAKCNILSGRYPCDQSSALRLAGMQARIELGKYDPEIHTHEYFKSRLQRFLPTSACKSKWSILNFGSKSGLEYRLLLQFKAFQDDVSLHTIMRQYMDYCWNLLFYGSAFFNGQLEKPTQGLAALIGYQDIPVIVAINSEGVSIISQAESKILLGLRYQDLSWDSARPSNENNPNCLPCLFLQFQVVESEQRVFKVLQVFSKQAILMDAIISSFVRALRQSWDRDEVDYSVTTSPGDCTPDADDAHTPLTTSSLYGSTINDVDSNLINNLHRLSLATFNEDGTLTN